MPQKGIVTLVERHSRFCVLVKVPGKDKATVVAALSRHVRELPATLRRSLTWDRGLEIAQHKSFTVATDVQVYFCDPQSPWQCGSNENTNGLLRQYLPKKVELPATRSQTWTRSPFVSISGHERRWDFISELGSVQLRPEQLALGRECQVGVSFDPDFFLRRVNGTGDLETWIGFSQKYSGWMIVSVTFSRSNS